MTTETKNSTSSPDKFMFKMDHCLTYKNNMDKEISEFLHSIDGTLIHSSTDLGFFKDLLKDRIQEIHEKHPRCKELRLQIWSFSSIDAAAVSCGCSSAKIYSVKQNFMQP